MPPRAVASPTSPPRELRPGFEAQTRKPATASSVRPTHPPHGHVSRQPSRLAPATRSTPPVFSRRCRSESTTAGRPSSSVPRPKPHVRPSPHSAHRPGTSSLAFTTPSSTVSCNSCTPQADRHGRNGLAFAKCQSSTLANCGRVDNRSSYTQITRAHINLVFAVFHHRLCEYKHMFTDGNLLTSACKKSICLQMVTLYQPPVLNIFQ
jgi:hypothetical protein